VDYLMLTGRRRALAHAWCQHAFRSHVELPAETAAHHPSRLASAGLVQAPARRAAAARTTKKVRVQVLLACGYEKYSNHAIRK
jgi:hypothetical protein